MLMRSAGSSMDRASDYGSEGWGFDSLPARWQLRASRRLGRSRVRAGYWDGRRLSLSCMRERRWPCGSVLSGRSPATSRPAPPGASGPPRSRSGARRTCGSPSARLEAIASARSTSGALRKQMPMSGATEFDDEVERQTQAAKIDARGSVVHPPAIVGRAGGGLSARHDPSLPLKRKAVAVDASADRESERPGRGVPGLFANPNRASWGWYRLDCPRIDWPNG